MYWYTFFFSFSHPTVIWNAAPKHKSGFLTNATQHKSTFTTLRDVWSTAIDVRKKPTTNVLRQSVAAGARGSSAAAKSHIFIFLSAAKKVFRPIMQRQSSHQNHLMTISGNKITEPQLLLLLHSDDEHDNQRLRFNSTHDSFKIVSISASAFCC